MTDTLSKNETIKARSRGLRGTLAEGLARIETGAIAEDDQQLVKFHGMYLQDERDLRAERAKKLVEKAYSFMIRLRIAGGVVTPAQWLKLDRIARDYGGAQMRITTRQTFQFHGVIKTNLKETMAAIDAAALDTLAACGDVNRNVLAAANPHRSRAHAAALDLARAISDHLLPRTAAYREIWLDGEPVAGGEPQEEPIYGKVYLPRKFKAVVAVPPDNDVDVFAQDLGFVAVLDEAGDLAGWNVTVGGGMGMTHGEEETYPRTADVIGFCAPQDALAVAEAVVTTQRDWGDRANRKRARLKYTIDDHGLDAFRTELERRIGKALGAPRPVAFRGNGDRYGWVTGEDGLRHLTLFVENGRLRDEADGPRRLGGFARLAEALAEVPGAEFRLTANQNVVLANIPEGAHEAIDRMVAEHGLDAHAGALRRNAMACVALPTCGLALAESERYLPSLVTALEARLAAHGLGEDEIVMRMTGCPNGCARPYLAEIGLVGKGPGRYNLYLGGAFDGSRLSKLYAPDLDHDAILATLDPLLAAYAAERETGERFGDFLVRAGRVAATTSGRTFHESTGPLTEAVA